MRIIFHIDSLGSGGAQRQIVTLALGMMARGHDVEFNTYFPFDHFTSALKQAEIPVHYKSKGGRFSLSPLMRLRCHVRRFRADAVIAFLRTPVLHAELLKILCPGTRVVVSERSFFPKGNLSCSLRATQAFHRLADAVAVNSQHQADRMLAEFPWLRGKIHVVLNGYDLSGAPTPISELKGELHLLSLASVHAGKNPMALARALRICRVDKGLPVSIRWAGEPWIVDGRYEAKEEVDAYLTKHGLSDAWQWLGLRSDVPQLFEDVHALVHTSLGEGFANVVAEALIAARPVLLGRIGDQVNLVEQSRAGLLFDPQSPDSIACAIDDFHAMTDKNRMQMAQSGRTFAEANLSLDIMVERYIALCRPSYTGQDKTIIQDKG